MENATFELTSELTEAELTRVSAQFESAAPETILEWALEAFGQDVALATGFGAEGCVLVHMLAQINPNARMFYLDTGLLFPETYELKAKLETRYGVQIERRASRLSVDAQARLHGDRLWEREPNRCCQLRKIEPLVETLSDLRAWVTAIRRDQSVTRASSPIVSFDSKFDLIKINPLATWTSQDVWRFIFKHKIPYNPLHDQQYPSIGCTPCTTPVQIGEHSRAGRWRGTEKTECGLHR